MLTDTFFVMPVILHDDDGYWLASRDEMTGELNVVGFHYCEDILEHESNVAPSFVSFLITNGASL
jgi:hypothetical protein